MIRRTFICIPVLIASLYLNGCAPFKAHFGDNKEYVLKNDAYEYAIYTGDGKLLTHPIHNFIKHRKEGQQYTDVYVMSHGWNYTIPEAIANYHSYMEIINKHKKGQLAGDSFKPYFIFVTWSSVTRPFTDATKAILPFDLDSSLSDVTAGIDKLIFFIPSVWKQSLNAHTIALGRVLPEVYRRQEKRAGPQGADPTKLSSFALGKPDCSLEHKAACYDVKDTAIGADYPVSALVYDLFNLKSDDQKSGLKGFNIHLVGHSYGGKVVALAGMEALRRWQIERTDGAALKRPLESLVLLNPAMNPREFDYVVDYRGEGLDLVTNPFVFANVPELLGIIPRKAIVYSNYDYPNGVYFDISQIVLNNHKVQIAQAAMRTTESVLSEKLLDDQGTNEGTKERSMLRRKKAAYEFINKLILPINGAIQLGTNLAAGSLSWATTKILNLPYDFAYHVRNNNTFGRSDNSFLNGLRYAYNGLAFFLPIDHLKPGQPVDQLGILRSTKPALGKGGLNKTGAGRTGYLNTDPLTMFISPETDIEATKFCALSKQLHITAGSLPDGVPVLRPDAIYSFDGSLVFDGGLDGSINPVGAHSDVGTNDEMKCSEDQLEIMEKREYSTNFIYNFTQVMKEAAH